MSIVVRLLLYIMAAGCIRYSMTVASVNSGSKFFLVWDVIGVALVLLAIGIKLDLWSRLGKSVKIVIVSLLSVGVMVFGVLTNNFHMKRALFLAKRQGIENPAPVVADSTDLFAPNNVLREVLGLAKDIVVN